MLPIFVVDAFTDVAFRGNPAAVCVLPEDDAPGVRPGVWPGDDWMLAVTAEMKHSETAFARRQAGRDPGDWDLRWFTPAVEVEDALGAVAVVVCDIHSYLLAELGDAATVRDLTPDFAAIAALDARAVVVTAASDDPQFDFVSRTFGPRAGIDEDPVTGSAHCALAPYWGPPLGRATLIGRQVSTRGGALRCTLTTGVDDDRVLLAGAAVTVTRGALVVWRPGALRVARARRHAAP